MIVFIHDYRTVLTDAKLAFKAEFLFHIANIRIHPAGTNHKVAPSDTKCFDFRQTDFIHLTFGV